MNTYKIQQRIKTVASNWITNYHDTAQFDIDNVSLEQEFTIQAGPKGDYWFATFDVESIDRVSGYQIFIDKLNRIISRMSLIGQGYISFYGEPFLITRSNIPNVGLLKFVKECGHVGLGFTEKHKQALEILIDNKKIADEFFLYWLDATNTTGYSAKLLLIFAAIESLNRTRDTSKHSKKENLTEEILGSELNKIIFDKKTGLRNRLTHGEYIQIDSRNFVVEIHQKIVSYFNKEILQSDLINVDVVAPQRHFHDNKEELVTFIEPMNGENENPLLLKNIMEKFVPYEKQSFYRQIKTTEFNLLKANF